MQMNQSYDCNNAIEIKLNKWATFKNSLCCKDYK